MKGTKISNKNANDSLNREIKKRNKILDKINFKKKIENIQLNEVHKKQISDKIADKFHNSSVELDNDQIMIQNLKIHENSVIKQEKYEELKRRILCRKNLDDQKIYNMSMGNIRDTNEFELNKPLLDKISPLKI